MIKLNETKYRIITDNYSGYECQSKTFWFPFWVQMDVANTHSSIEDAKEYIFTYKNKNKKKEPKYKVVWESDKDSY